MSAIILKILSILGIILLVLLGILLVAILLILFFPITYKAYGKKEADNISAWVKANWLFGLVRLRFAYPEPGNVTVKALFFTIYDYQKSQDAEEKTSEKVEENTLKEQGTSEKQATQNRQATSKEQALQNRQATSKEQEEQNTQTHQAKETSQSNQILQNAGNTSGEESKKQPQKSFSDIITAKYEKIKYTILKICDKIKYILENLAFYKELYDEKQTRELLKHAFIRLRKVLKHIKPRKFQADLLIGTGEPDTTGYVLAIYGMLYPGLPQKLNITPDFNRQILEGEASMAGHIMVFTILIHALQLAMDEKLWILVRKIKKHKAKQRVNNMYN